MMSLGQFLEYQEKQRHNRAVLERIEEQFRPKPPELPPVITPAMRKYIGKKLGYVPSDKTVLFVLQHYT